MIETLTTLFASTTFIIGAWIGIAVLVAILLEFEKEGWATTFVSLGIALLMWNYRTAECKLCEKKRNSAKEHQYKETRKNTGLEKLIKTLKETITKKIR